jgi:hypothetical protein
MQVQHLSITTGSGGVNTTGGGGVLGQEDVHCLPGTKTGTTTAAAAVPLPPNASAVPSAAEMDPFPAVQ